MKPRLKLRKAARWLCKSIVTAEFSPVWLGVAGSDVEVGLKRFSITSAMPRTKQYTHCTGCSVFSSPRPSSVSTLPPLPGIPAEPPSNPRCEFSSASTESSPPAERAARVIGSLSIRDNTSVMRCIKVACNCGLACPTPDGPDASRSGRASGPVSDQSPRNLSLLTRGGETRSLLVLTAFNLSHTDGFGAGFFN